MAIRRPGEAKAEIRAGDGTEAVTAAKGAVRLIEKLTSRKSRTPPGLHAVIREVSGLFVPLIGTVGVAAKTRRRWAKRRWPAMVA